MTFSLKKTQKLMGVFSLLLSQALVSSVACAEVLENSESYFVVELVELADASPADAYKVFSDVATWWNAEHSWFGKAENFSLELKAGGCFCETDGARQVKHMEVVFVDPEREVKLLGGLGPLQTMAVSGAMTWKFDASANGQTRITHRYTVSGSNASKLDQIAPAVDAVQHGQLKNLVKAIASKRVQ